MKLNAKELRNIPESECPKPDKYNPIYFISDNILDTQNLGGLFRLCDALAAEHFFICGEKVETPPNAKIRSSSSGTYKVVNWTKLHCALNAITILRSAKKDIKIYAIEQPREGFKHSGRFDRVEYHKPNYWFSTSRGPSPVAFVLGNEQTGISDEVLNAVDAIIDIPMWGINKSLNVIVAASIVGYEVMKQWGL